MAADRSGTRWVLMALGVLVAGVVGLLALGTLLGGSDERVEPPPEATSTTLTRPPLEAPEEWTQMAELPGLPRSRPVAAWTGEELILWRGAGGSSDNCGSASDGSDLCGEPMRNDGFSYDPATETWRELPADPLPPGLGSWVGEFKGVWTGTEFVVWGGVEASGAAYDPATDTWRSVADGPLSRRRGFAMVWTGTEAIIVGGQPLEVFDAAGNEDFVADAAAYDPFNDDWRTIPSPPELDDSSFSGAVWGGSQLIVARQIVSQVQGEVVRGSQVDFLDPVADAWRAPVNSDAVLGGPVWTGDEVFFSGWVSTENDQGGAGVRHGLYRLTDSEGAVTEVEGYPFAERPNLRWTGRELLVFSTTDCIFEEDPCAPTTRLAGYEPVAGVWRDGLPPPEPIRFSGATWTGAELLVYGGFESNGFTGRPAGRAGSYRPGPGR
jgi:hypothetical protein